MGSFFLGLARDQAGPQLDPVGLLGLDRAADRLRFLRPAPKVVRDLCLVSEIPVSTA